MSKIQNKESQANETDNGAIHIPVVSGLLSCPFCGADCEIERWEDMQGEYRVKCKGVCEHKLDAWMDTEEDAIAMWNTRSKSFEPTDEQIEQASKKYLEVIWDIPKDKDEFQLCDEYKEAFIGMLKILKESI